MAYVDVVVPLVPYADAWEPVSPRLFQLQLWDRFVRTELHNRVTRKPYEAVLDRLDQWADHQIWEATTSRLLFRCDDADGVLAVQAALGAHLLELALAVVLDVPDWGIHFMEKGFEARPARDVVTQVSQSSALFVELRREVYRVETSRKGVKLFECDTALTWDELKPAEQAKVQAVVDSKRCACQYCEYNRPRAAREAAEHAKRWLSRRAGRAKAHLDRKAAAAASAALAAKPKPAAKPAKAKAKKPAPVQAARSLARRR